MESESFITKAGQVRKHLKRYKSIDTWTAITKYGATRLSAIIFNLRKNGWQIATVDNKGLDRNRKKSEFAKYVLINLPQGDK